MGTRSGRITGGGGAHSSERPGGSLETPGLRGTRGPLKGRPPEITRQIQYMIATYLSLIHI